MKPEELAEQIKEHLTIKLDQDRVSYNPDNNEIEISVTAILLWDGECFASSTVYVGG